MPILARHLVALGALTVGIMVNCFFLSVPLFSAEEERNSSAFFRAQIGVSSPNAMLPKQVVAPQGRLTLFADYGAADQTGVPLFLVNRTATSVSFASQDSDIYIKLEALRRDGVWQRAQSHFGSPRGSYGFVTLLPGQFFQFRGYAANHGPKERVRFSGYGNVEVLSNEGEGAVSPEDLDAASVDYMALQDIPTTFVTLLSQDKNLTPGESAGLSKRVAALRLLQSYADCTLLKRDALRLAEQITGSASPSDEDRQTAAIIRRIVAEPWPKQKSPKALFERCARALQDKESTSVSDFGMPERQPELLWSVLADLAKRAFNPEPSQSPLPGAPDPGQWAPLVEKMTSVIYAGSITQRQEIARILAIAKLADEILPNEFFEATLLQPDPLIRMACADALSRRRQWARLAELGWKLDAEGQCIVFAALAHPPSEDGNGRQRGTRDPENTGEDKFWEHCLVTQTVKAVWELSGQGTEAYRGSFGTTVHDALHDFLLHEAQKSDDLGHDFRLGDGGFTLAAAVKVLGGFGEEEDREVFRRLLSYRGFQGAVEFPRYLIRETASEVLRHREGE